MQRLDRLERVTDLLLVLLDAPRPLSLREIANRVPGYPDSHDARRQAFERDKRLLRDEGVPVLVVPIGGEDQLGYRVDPDSYYLPDLGLEAEEQAALNLAVAGVHLGEPIGRDALSKLGGGRRVAPQRPRPHPLVDLRSVDGLPGLPVVFDAIRQSAAVRFDYRGERRHVDVAGLRFRNGRWYVIGFDRERGEAGPSGIDRIDSTPEIDAPQDRPGPPTSTSMRPSPATLAVRLRRKPWRWRSWWTAWRPAGWPPSWAAGRRGGGYRSDGSVVVRLAVTDTGALILWVLDLLDHAEVLQPDAVRAAVVERLEAVAAGGGVESVTTTDTGGRLRRLLAILAWLAQVGEAPIDEVAAQFDLTPEALVTELEMAACCGVPPYTPDQLMEIVVTETTVSTRVGTALARPRRLSPSEGFALATSARALLAVTGSDESGALSRALVKLDQALGADEVAVELDAPPFLALVREALDRGRRLIISYYSASTDKVTDREIRPLRLFGSEGHWYVDARCETADGVRRFRVDRIGAADLVQGTEPAGSAGPTDAGDDVDRPARPGDGTGEGTTSIRSCPGADSRRVRLSLEPSTAWLIDSIPSAGPRAEVDGRVELELFVGGDAWLERLLLRLGPDVRVLDPPEDRPLAAEAATRILRRYQKDR